MLSTVEANFPREKMFKKEKGPPKTCTSEEKVKRFRKLAESEILRSMRAGKIEAISLHAIRGNAFAALVASYQLSPNPEPLAMPQVLG